MTPRLFIGTVGFSVWFSDDLGQTLNRLQTAAGLYTESRIFSFTSHPDRPGEMFVGTDSGVYRLDTVALKFTHLPSPMDNVSVWSLAQAPNDPSVLLAGTRPAGVFRSTDSGKTWEKTDGDFPETCRAVILPRLTKVQFDADDPQLVWAGVELGGIWRSTDGGKHWKHASEGMTSDDIHDITVVYDKGTRTVIAATNVGPHVSRDAGLTWELKPLESQWRYTRGVTPSPERNGLVWLGHGDGVPGSQGKLMRSRDSGFHWEDAGLPGKLFSSVWCIATNAADPKLIFATTCFGQYFRSTDGGDTWTMLPRPLGETRALAWVPV